MNTRRTSARLVGVLPLALLGAGGVVAEPESYRPATDLQGAERGRRVADEIVERTLEPFGGVGPKPAPVMTQTRPVHGDEGGR